MHIDGVQLNSSSSWSNPSPYLVGLDFDNDEIVTKWTYNNSSAQITRLDSLPSYSTSYTKRFGGYVFRGTTTLIVDKNGNFITGVSGGSYWEGSLVELPWSYYVTFTGGSGGPGVKYLATDDSGLYNDSYCLSPCSSVSIPTSTGYLFKGYFSGQNGTGTQYVDAAGNVLTALSSLSPSQNVTCYAAWESRPVVTLNKNGGSGGTSTIYYNPSDGRFYTNTSFTTVITRVSIPSKYVSRFNGYFVGSTKVIDADGTILSSFRPSANTTATASWDTAIVITIDKAGGSGGTSQFFYLPSEQLFYSDEGLSSVTLMLSVPTKSGALFLRCIDAGGNEVVTSSGRIVQSFAPTANATINCVWKVVHTVTLVNGKDLVNGSILYDETADKFYSSDSVEITSVVPPVFRCWRFLGYWSESSDGVLYVNPDGSFTASFLALRPSADISIYGRWQFVSYALDFSAGGGALGTAAIFNSGADSIWYADDQLTTAISSIVLPIREGYTFTGYSSESLGTVVTSGGLIVAPSISADASATAQWSANTYTLRFQANQGSVSPTSKSVTFGAAVGGLPTPTRGGIAFIEWRVNGVAISASTVYSWPHDVTAVAVWNTSFGDVVDYFGLQTANLIPVESSSGDDVKRIAIAHYGRHDAGVNATSVAWRNPSVTYKVVGNVTLSVNLGKAFAAASGVTGYMITSVAVHTKVGEFPTVVVDAVANEGANAINLFPVSLSISGNAHAQNLMSSISGGGRLQSCSLVASATPIVVEENMAPCASDVVRGIVCVTGETVADVRQAAPVAANGFTALGEPRVCSDGDFQRWAINLKKELS